MKVKNFDGLAVSEARRSALSVIEAGYEAIDTEKVIRNNIRLETNTLYVKDKRFSLEGAEKLFLVGVGKCAVEAAIVLENILGERLTSGIVVDVKNGSKLKKTKAFVGTHPLPSRENIRAAKEIVDTLGGLGGKDFVIFIVSGGGSTLLCLPKDLASEEEVSIMKTLTRAGAAIQEINTVRKHLSLARGGRLAQYAYPARVVSLIFSDVPGDDIGFVASGPTVKDETTVLDAEAILDKYDVLKVCGIEKCGLIETPKDEKYFKNVVNTVIVSNVTALEAMEGKAMELGYQAKIYNTRLTGEAQETAINIVNELHSAPPKSVLLYGGETTVTVKGEGRGGRNLELVLSALREIQPDEIIVAVASDGRDNGKFAGAICDIITKEAAEKNNLNIQQFLDESNSYPFFEKIGHYLLTGDTGSNVSDLIVAVKS